ncbi:MAG: DUF4340 domain-containing protein [Stenotrophobium sp.]
MNRMTLNLVLVVVVIGLGITVLLSQKKTAKPTVPVTPLTASTLDSVVIDHPGSPTIKLQKIKGIWQLTAPVQTATDSFEMNAFTDLAAESVKTTFDPKQVNLKDLGLDPPGYSVTLNGQKIEFGGIEPINYHRYIRTNGKIQMIADPPGTALDADYSDLVSRSLLPENAQIAAIALPGQTITRSADDKSWALSPPHPELKDADVQKLAGAWASAKSLWNAAETQDEIKKDDKGETVSVTLKNQPPIKFIVITQKPQLVLARPDLGVRYTLSEQLAETLLQLPKPEPAPAEAKDKK